MVESRNRDAEACLSTFVGQADTISISMSSRDTAFVCLWVRMHQHHYKLDRLVKMCLFELSVQLSIQPFFHG